MRVRLILAGAGLARAALAGLRQFQVQSQPCQSQPGQSQPGQSQPGQSQPGQSQPGQSQPGQSQPGRSQPGQRRGWERTNFRGRTVSLAGGPALAGAATLTAAIGAGTPRLRAAAIGVGAAGALLGGYDDAVGARPSQAADKGLHGHLSALRAGRVSAGAVKLIGLSVAGVVAAGAVAQGPVQRVVAGGVIAGAANLVNLLDLRPGRALKTALLLGVPLLHGPHGGLVAGPVGAAVGVLPDDLGERVMLGDAGANAIGALLGLRLAAGASPAARWALLVGLAGLTVASERVSFSKVIAETPGLRELDALGRQPQ